MIKELKQKKRFEYRNHRLYEDKIVVEQKTLKDVLKYEIRIDQLGFEIQYEKENNFAIKITLIVLLIAPFIVLVGYLLNFKVTSFGVVSSFIYSFSLALILSFKKTKDNIFLIGHKNLVFYRDIPNEKEVLEFIELIKNTLKNYLKKKFLSLNENITEEEYFVRLKWLLNETVITNEEFNEFKEDFKIKELLK